MEKYVGICCGDEFSRPMEIETLIPKEIVIQVESALNGINNHWRISSPMIDTQSLVIIFELAERLSNGFGSKYKITISKL